jgi:hypothetical protein
MIENQSDMLEHLCAEDIEQAKRNVYKYTDCGAWIEFNEDGIVIGSIVEGCDFGTADYHLNYPFTEERYSNCIEAIEKEASLVWDWANEVDDTGTTAQKQGCDPPDVYRDYRHLSD